MKLAVTEVGNFTLCYWSRGVDDISEWGSPNPLPMARKFEAYSNASVLPSSCMPCHCGSCARVGQGEGTAVGCASLRGALTASVRCWWAMCPLFCFEWPSHRDPPPLSFPPTTTTRAEPH